MVWVQSAGGEPRQLMTPCDAPPPSPPGSGIQSIEELWKWSPVGARLAYARVDGQTDELFVVDPVDGRRTSLGTADGDLTALEWSPDGSRIAYADGRSVYEVAVDGGERSLLADSFVDIIDIAWSPDGTQILVHDQGRYRMQVMNADGSDLHLLLEGKDACCETEWSTDAGRILYQLSVVRPGQPDWGLDSEVWTVSPDGSNQIKVFDSDGCAMGDTQDALPVWAPNGTQVA
jgi:Tol biopolymer transport system component